MKKLIVCVVVLFFLIAGTWAGTTYWTGIKTEQHYRTLLQQASQQVQVLSFANESYERGFLGSKARTLIKVKSQPDAAQGTKPVQVTLVHDITHGPLPLGASVEGKEPLKPLLAIIETKILFGPEVHEDLARLYAEVPEIAAIRDITIIHLDGKGEERFVIPAFQRTFGSEDKVAANWKGLFLQVNFTSDFKTFSGSLRIPGLEVSMKEVDIKLKEMKFAGEFRETPSTLMVGEGSFDLESMEFAEKKDGTSHPFQIEGISARNSNKAVGDNFNYTLAVRMSQLRMDKALYGPGVFEMELRNLDTASVVKLQEAARDLQSSDSQQSSEEAQAKMLTKLGGMLPGFFKKSPELEITKIELKTNDGDFAGRIKVGVDGTKSVTTVNLLTLANALTAQAELKVSERLLRRVASSSLKSKIISELEEQDEDVPGEQELDAMASQQIDEQLKALMAQNLIVKEQGAYKANASYSAGEIVLNGKTLSLQDLFQ